MNFGFSNLLGSPYRGGNAAFYKDFVYIGVGNRVARIQLSTSTTSVMRFEAQCNIEHIKVRSDGALLAVVDSLGHLLLVNVSQHLILHRMSLKGAAQCMEFSPDGMYIAVGVGKLLQVWECNLGNQKSFAPLKLHVTYGSCQDSLSSLSWHSSNNWIVAGSKDLACHIFSKDKIEGFKGSTLTGHRDKIVLADFVHDSGILYTLSVDGKLLKWSFKADDESDGKDFSKGSWLLDSKNFVERQGSKITSCHMHSTIQVLIIGFTGGRFEIYQLPEFTALQTMSVSRESLSTTIFNASGDLIAIGCAKLGQLLVWDWRAETYVFKQQGHFYDVLSIDFSKDGSLLVTGSADGKVKIWNIRSGQSFVTFNEHKMPVTSVLFLPANHAVASASMDGTVRAYDLIRYRNFRTFQPPEPTQFSCLTVDASGDIIAAGSKDTFQIYLWSMKTGKILDVFSGHEGPVSCISFDYNGTILASSSWDKTVQLWDTFTGKGRKETLTHYHDVLCLAYRPDGKQLCTGSLDGQLTFWDAMNSSLQGTIDGRLDITGGRLSTDARTLANSSSGKCFTTICYSADGETLFAAGSSKYVCVYDTSELVLLSRIQITSNASLDGVVDRLNSKYVTEGGVFDPLYNRESIEASNGKIGLLTPGGDVLPGTNANQRPVARTNCVRLSPAGDTWAAATTEGVLLYTKDESLLFDPFDLDEDVTPAAVQMALGKNEFARALLLSLHLKDTQIFKTVIERTPPNEIALVSTKIPPARLYWMMHALSECMSKTAHFEFYVMWCESILLNHGNYLKQANSSMTSALRSLHKNVNQTQVDISQTVEDNVFKLKYIAQVSKI